MMSSVLILFVLAGAESFGYFDTGSMDCSNYHDRDACLTCDNTYDIGDDPSNTPRCYWQWSGQSGGSGQGDGPNAGTCTNEDVCVGLGDGRDDQYYVESRCTLWYGEGYGTCRYHGDSGASTYYGYMDIEGDGFVTDLCQYLFTQEDCQACSGEERGTDDAAPVTLHTMNENCKLGTMSENPIWCWWDDTSYMEDDTMQMNYFSYCRGD